LKKFLQKEFGEQIPPINAVLAFTDDRADLQVQDAPYPALKVAALKEFFRKAAKSQPLPALEYKRITEALPQGSDEVK
jgi:hypothetical protein